ncbi:mandelate racemase/muconate lactonizing enzyme family protein [Candidatus Latescibacterota bacterium]
MFNDFNFHMSRRRFAQTYAIGAGTLLKMPLLSESVHAAQDMKIVKIEASRDITWQGNSLGWLWVRLTTDTGLTGLGETYVFPNAGYGFMQDIAPRLIGRDPLDIEKLFDDQLLGFWSGWGGTNINVLSAINLAQWDLLGKTADLPIWRLLGGRSRSPLLLYNTLSDSKLRLVNGWPVGPNIEKITRFLMDQGLTAMKIVPYDLLANKHNGQYISPVDLDAGLDWVRRIRDTAGDDMDIAIEGHGRWNLPCSAKIAKSLEPYNVMWIEDMLRQYNPAAYQSLAAETEIPVCVSERLHTTLQFRELMELRAADVVMFDIEWCGGITEGKKIADLANTYYLPFATHNAGGPMLFLSSMHLGTACTNTMITESMYPYYTNIFPYFIEDYPAPENGTVRPPETPGLGVTLRKEPFEKGDLKFDVLAEV